MNAYHPLDLSESYNAGPDVLPAGSEVETGAVIMRGLPFRIGGADGNCFIALDGSAVPVTISVGGKANRVIFAHALLETSVPWGGPLGIPVADYVFRLSGGREERVPIRERFEIASAPFPGSGPGSAEPTVPGGERRSAPSPPSPRGAMGRKRDAVKWKWHRRC